MLTIYKIPFALFNIKLYRSPYYKNITEVHDTLKEFKPKCRLTFLKKLITLKIREVDKKELLKIGNNFVSAYDIKSNTIIKSKDTDFLNHELFHVARRRKRSLEVTNPMYDIDSNLEESIMEYLNLKSKKEKTSFSDYQEELFVIEFLIYIYTEKIIEPYLIGYLTSFFNLFKNQTGKVKELYIILSHNSYLKNIEQKRQNYLILSDIYSDILPDNQELLSQLTLNYKTSDILNEIYQKNKESLEELKKIPYIEVNNYKFKKHFKEKISKDWYLEQSSKLHNSFKEIINILSDISHANNLDDRMTTKLLIDIYKTKNEQFHNTYQELFQKDIKVRKLVK